MIFAIVRDSVGEERAERAPEDEHGEKETAAARPDYNPHQNISKVKKMERKDSNKILKGKKEKASEKEAKETTKRN